MKVRIEHVTRFRYETPASGSFNEARLTPRNDETQNLLSFELMVSPAAKSTSYRDHFGTLVHVFDIRPPHAELEVTGRSTVVTGQRRQPPVAAGDLDALRDPELQDREAEWLKPSALAGGGDHLRSFAHHVQTVVSPTSVVELVAGVNREVHSRFRYTVGSSYVSSTVDDLLERGTGVCQDFAHLAIATLRALGVPARYVSGYFYAGPPGEVELDVPLAVESHAWVEALIPGWGWVEVDPTNDCPADDRHVVVAVGRDYTDVAPLRGVLRGATKSSLSVRVTMVAPSDTGPRLAVIPPVVGPAGALAAVLSAGAQPAVAGAPGTSAASFGSRLQGPAQLLAADVAQQQQQQQ